ncbi:MAG: VWA domain-containing protein [Myxococcota bacterium]
MTKINTETKQPNNVWVFFTVEDGDEPVAGLEADDFEIYEDDGLVSPYESKQVIQNPEVASVMYTILLLDVSGSMTESGRIDELVDAAKTFTEKVGESQKVAVYAFDGSKEIHPVVPFTSRKGTIDGGLDGLRNWTPKDNSTNLHGAVVSGLDTLYEGLENEEKPLKFGTLVVFSDGADRASRVSRNEMREEMRRERYDDYEMYAIGIGDEEELAEAELHDIGRDGTFIDQSASKTSEVFEKVANKINGHSKRFYLLSYCTPARKGEHEVRIEVNLEDRGSGSLEYKFDADGFGPPPQCDPQRKPTFDLEDVTPEDDKVSMRVMD